MERKHIVWNVEKLNRLQDFLATTSQSEANYFGYQVGESIVEFCSYFVNDINKCDVLDYGCGLGHIMKCFCQKKVNVWGVDISKEAVTASKDRCGNSFYFHGVRTFDGGRLPYEDNRFDLITCTECIEHILPEHIDGVLDEIYRVLKPGGRFLITTRNEENFAFSELCCLECNTIYHRVGHVNWYSVKSLKKTHGGT
ncbi:class I SAM-dependent methyltransferase [Butyrivibrio sp. NC3005]|uniref:class I SAM-dependent methyltransferase n=1 Tax=Butyrivibrio sp. NC3005 TaxID=1280685 RepID=UPI000412CD86|nr:class I SAM-dependent methyltransferase [Butyrivibrio sp. NC3005]